MLRHAPADQAFSLAAEHVIVEPPHFGHRGLGLMDGLLSYEDD
jgi:hypothetical protein